MNAGVVEGQLQAKESLQVGGGVVASHLAANINAV